MALQFTEQAMSGRKRMLRMLGAWLMGLLIALTLFSNTLLTMNLPKVATVQPRTGEIAYHFAESGVVRPSEMIDLVQREGWAVRQVHVREGELVSQGQTLVSYDSREAELQLKLEQANRKKAELGLAELHNAYKEAAQAGDPSAMHNAELAIDHYKLDLEAQELRIQMLQERLADNREIVAPFDGLILEVNVREGLTGTVGGPAVRIANPAGGFEFEVLAPAPIADRLLIGDPIDVTLKGASVQRIEGRIAEMTKAVDQGALQANENASPVKSVRIILQNKNIVDGMQAQVNLTLSGESTDGAVLVPSRAVHEDPAGAYLYTVSERRGSLGNAFYVNKTYVNIVETNDIETAVEGLFIQSQIVIESSHPLQEGDRVRM